MGRHRPRLKREHTEKPYYRWFGEYTYENGRACGDLWATTGTGESWYEVILGSGRFASNRVGYRQIDAARKFRRLDCTIRKSFGLATVDRKRTATDGTINKNKSGTTTLWTVPYPAYVRRGLDILPIVFKRNHRKRPFFHSWGINSSSK